MLKEKSKALKIKLVILLLLLPVFAIGLYQYLTKPELIEQISLLEELNSAESEEEKSATVEKMLLHIEQRLINEPDDIDGWLMLTNSYTALERYPEALRAINNLYRLRSEDPTVLIRYAEILSKTNGGVLLGNPTKFINQALQIDPENANGLWLAGLAANERGDINNAIQFWQRLLPKLEEGSKPQLKIKQYIQLANQHLSEPKNKVKRMIVPIDEEITSDQTISLLLKVSLSNDLINETHGDDTVFIFAKTIKRPIMLLAAASKKVKNLPLQVILDDSMAIISSNKLSDHKHVQLIARISKDGTAKAKSGDLYGTLDIVQTDTDKPINLIIDKKAP